MCKRDERNLRLISLFYLITIYIVTVNFDENVCLYLYVELSSYDHEASCSHGFTLASCLL
jgi:hypothetical protein